MSGKQRHSECSCQIFSEFNIPKIKKRLIFDIVIQKNKKVDDVGTSVDEPFCRTTWRINIVVCQSMLARIRAFY